MPSEKRRLEQIQRENSKLAKTNHSITSFLTGSPARCPNTPTKENIPPTSPVTPKASTPKKSKHNASGYDKSWENSRPWLNCIHEDQRELMYCRLCQLHDTKGLNGSSKWNKEGYACIRLDKVKEHELSEQHRQALEFETKEQLGITDALNQETISDKDFLAVQTAIKCLNFLLQRNIPYTDNFKSFIEFARDELHAPALQHLSAGSNAKYTSHRMVDEFIDTMAEHVEDTVVSKVKCSPAYSIMADESTDVSNRKHLIFSTKYVDSNGGEINTEFLRDVEIEDGKAETIFNETRQLIESDLRIDNFVAFGSDGCNTMIGSKSGVATRLKDVKPNIINIHCHNHRLALAAKNSFEDIPLFRDVDDTLTHIFKYYHYSATRTKSLEKIQKLLNEDDNTKTIKNALHTRWLSHQNAVTSLRDTYEAVIADLENATASGHDKVRIGSGPSAAGMVKKLKKPSTIRVVHFLCDALKPVTQLALTFEKNEVELTNVHPRLESTVMTLERLKEKDGPNTLKSEKMIGSLDLKWEGNRLDEVKKCEKLFIDSLVRNIRKRNN